MYTKSTKSKGLTDAEVNSSVWHNNSCSTANYDMIDVRFLCDVELKEICECGIVMCAVYAKWKT